MWNCVFKWKFFPKKIVNSSSMVGLFSARVERCDLLVSRMGQLQNENVVRKVLRLCKNVVGAKKFPPPSFFLEGINSLVWLINHAEKWGLQDGIFALTGTSAFFFLTFNFRFMAPFLLCRCVAASRRCL